jgi:hypothetical protein
VTYGQFSTRSACATARDALDQRASNAHHALALLRDFTGATLNEFARVLRKAGTIRVDRWVVARTLPR